MQFFTMLRQHPDLKSSLRSHHVWSDACLRSDRRGRAPVNIKRRGMSIVDPQSIAQRPNVVRRTPECQSRFGHHPCPHTRHTRTSDSVVR